MQTHTFPSFLSLTSKRRDNLWLNTEVKLSLCTTFSSKSTDYTTYLTNSHQTTNSAQFWSFVVFSRRGLKFLCKVKGRKMKIWPVFEWFKCKRHGRRASNSDTITCLNALMSLKENWVKIHTRSQSCKHLSRADYQSKVRSGIYWIRVPFGRGIVDIPCL